MVASIFQAGEFVARFVNERRQRPDEDGTQQEPELGQEPRRRHDRTVAGTDSDRRSSEAVRGENGLSAQVCKKFVGRHLQAESLVE
jgi:hypothetical protein